MKLQSSRHIRHLSLAGLAVLLGACKASPTTLSVIGSNPANNATAVARTIQPSVVYSLSMNPATVTTTSVQLLGPGSVVIPSTPGVNGATVFLNPTAGAIPGGTTYDLRVQGSVTSQSGFILNTVYNLSFTTAPQTWQSAAAVGNAAAGSFQNPVLVADGSGNVTATWIQNSGSGTALEVSRYTQSSGTWSAPSTLESATAALAGAGPAAVVDSNGNVTVAWVKNDSAATTLDAFVYTSTSNSWSTATAITPSLSTTGAITNPVLAVDTTGVVTAAWVQNNGSRTVLNSNRLSGGAWATATEIDGNPATGNAASPAITVDTSNNVTVVWVQNNGTRNILNANRYSGAWATPVEVDSSTATGAVSGPTLAVDPAGDVMSTWLQDNGTGSHNILNAARWSAGSWAAPAEVDLATAPGSAIAPVMAEDSAGNVTLVWTQAQASGGLNVIMTSRYTNTAGAWGTPLALSTGSADAENPAVVADVAGNATVAWYQGGTINSAIYSSTNSGWGTPTSAGAADSNDTPLPALAVDATGTVIAAWLNATDTQIASNRLQ